MNKKLPCPNCGKSKNSWYALCIDCSKKEAQKPRCEVCDNEIPKGHYLCKKHYSEKQLEKKNLSQIKYVKKVKEEEFKQKFEGKYYSSKGKVKSKSELLISYFLDANMIQFHYEPRMDIDGEIRPDFVLEDGKGNSIILEHFGLDDKKYLERKKAKIKAYKKLCKEIPSFYFKSTTEEDIYNLKDRLGRKLNETPLKRALWK